MDPQLCHFDQVRDCSTLHNIRHLVQNCLVSSFVSFRLNTRKYISLWKVVTIPPILAFRIVHKQFPPNAKFAIKYLYVQKYGEFVLYHSVRRRSMSLITGNITLNQSVALKQC